ncbi:MAG: energy-coupling factor transporter transmembrane protein EcfT [Actinobacteria bacterium]|nr:energy-coupling factor transporter transmembrane protein EcfT [Actinomycetota bacterium]
MSGGCAESADVAAGQGADVRLRSGSLAVGQYLPGSSVLHRIDPRVKLGISVVYACLLFVVIGWWGMATMALGLVAGVAISRVPVMYLWRFLRPFVVILVITLFFQAMSLPGEVLLALGPFRFTTAGLAQGGVVVTRLLLLLLSGALLVVTTPPVAVTDAIAWYFRPLRRVGVPSGDVALVMSLALRFIPVLMTESDQLVKAQRARGIALTIRSPLRSGRALLPLVVPLFVLGFRRAEELADAMLSRCYRGTEGRTHYREMRLAPVDAVWLLTALVWFGCALVLGRGWVGW